jgi:phospholipid/cholesterol/gamma-HCH transport system permease protein
MKSNQELDALEVMGISPVRFLVATALLSTMILMPLITFWADIAALMGAGLYVSLELGMSLGAFVDQCLSFIAINDLFHGLGKSIIFAILIVVIGVVNGASVEGGAEGVGHMTTRSVVHSISAIVLTDMLFALVVTR